MPSFVFYIIVGLALILGLALVFLRNPPQKNLEHPYTKKSFFSKAERSFLGVLEQALTDDYRIFAKVRLADLIKVKSGLSKSAWQSAFNRINSKHIDFVVNKSDDLSLVCAIELDDKSHQKRKSRDEFVNKALEAAGIPLFRFPVKQAYELTEIRTTLEGILNTRERQENPPRKLQESITEPVKTCPKCESQMIIRTAKKGENKGKEFLACSAYPKCRTIMPLHFT